MVSFSQFGWTDSSYFTPPFPSLYWPINNEKYSWAYLYYIPDIWFFTAAWTMIFFAGFYAISAMISVVSHRRTFDLYKVVWVFFYLAVGATHGLVSGTVIGFLIGVMYRAGLFGMSTWIPLCVAVVQVLLIVVSTHSSISMTIWHSKERKRLLPGDCCKFYWRLFVFRFAWDFFLASVLGTGNAAFQGFQNKPRKFAHLKTIRNGNDLSFSCDYISMWNNLWLIVI